MLILPQDLLGATQYFRYNYSSGVSFSTLTIAGALTGGDRMFTCTVYGGNTAYSTEPVQMKIFGRLQLLLSYNTGICLTEWLASQNGQICKWFCN